jgi:hypothetical protein
MNATDKYPLHKTHTQIAMCLEPLNAIGIELCDDTVWCPTSDAVQAWMTATQAIIDAKDAVIEVYRAIWMAEQQRDKVEA